MTPRTRLTLRIAALLLSLAGLSGAAHAADPPATAPKAVPGIAPAPKRRPPLLREGSFITRVAGSLESTKDRKEWTFSPTALDPSGLRREFGVLPNETLAEAIRTSDLAPSQVSFEATGEIFIYQGRNYLLLSMMTPVVAPATSPAPKPATPPSAPADTASAKPAKTASAAAQKPTTPPDEETIAADLEKRLAERIGSMPKSPVATPNPADTTTRPRAADQASNAAAEQVAPETRLQSRRGRLMRDAATGGWRFVFEGQTARGGEPSMPILPCLALERVEQLVREADGRIALLVSGQTTSFEGRTFLLPTSFRVARGGKGIDP
ncbi:MAG: hypothetical protein U0572_07690 [Phycisphaerales bacterium]